MEQLEKTSTPAYKRCRLCGAIKAAVEFYRSKNGAGGLSFCCKLCDIERLRKYFKTPKGEQSRRAAVRQYNNSEKGKAHHKIYAQSLKGIITGRRKSLRYYYSPQGMEKIKCYRDSGRAAELAMMRYYGIQDEAGCHIHVNAFYPGYRFLKALQNAEVVNI